MVAEQLASLYQDLKRAFDARPSDLRKCGTLLAQLKVGSRPHSFACSLTSRQVGLIETGLLLPQGEQHLEDLVVARECLPTSTLSQLTSLEGEILEIGAFWSIRSKDVPSFDRYFAQLQTFYRDYRQVP